MTEADFEACSLWPILVDFGDGAAYTLWGSGGGDDDRLLAVAGRLRRFRRWPRLVEWVLADDASNMAALAGYAALKSRLRSPGNRVPEEPKRYPFAEVQRWIAGGSAASTAARAATTLDCLNLLWDAARTLELAAVQAQLRRGASPLGAFMDALMVARDGAELPWSAIAAAYDDVCEQIAARWDVE